MPLEPTRKIEELLAAYAKKRREQAGAPLDLTPVNRARLHGEVARRFRGSSRPRSGWQMLAALWPRFALAGGLAAVLALAIFLPLMRSPETQERVAQVAVPSASAPIKEKGLVQDEDSMGESLGVADGQVTRNRSVGERMSGANEIADTNRVLRDYRTAEVPLQSRDSVANFYVTMPVEPPKAKSDVSGRESAQNQSLWFKQNSVRTDWVGGKAETAPAPAPQVLTSFTVERSGDNVRVVDDDGSVYLGQVTNTPAGTSSQSGNSVAVQNAPVVLDQNFDFQVSGTNRRLQQQVFFSGSVTQDGITQQSNAFGQGGRGSVQPAQSQIQAQNRSQVVGQVQVGSAPTNTFPINAETE